MNAHRMALVPTVFVGALLTLAATTQETADPGVQLQAAIEAEEVDGDLEAAIALYRQVVEAAGQDRALAARALLRLGGCDEKLGREEAARVYRRLVDDYPDQTEQVAAARRRLETLAKASAATMPRPRFRKLVIPSKPRYRSGGMLSPDGTLIAFVADGAVWTVPVSGQVHPDVAGEPRQLTPDMRAWDNGNSTVSWSPDGRWISFYTSPTDSLWVVPSAGGEPRLVLGDGGGGWGARSHRAGLSPDGSVLAFSQPHGKEVRLFTVAATGSEPRLLGPDWGIEAAYSPDGRHVAYVARDADGPPRLVKVIPAGGGESTVVAHVGEGASISPFWSPDGRKIAFVVWFWWEEGPGRTELWIVPLSDARQPAGEITKIDLNEVTAATDYGEPTQKYTKLAGWTSGGEIAVFTEVPWEEGIYTVSTSGGRATRVALEGREPRWSPDGARIYFRGHDGIEHVPPEGGESRLVPIRSDDELIIAFPMGSNAVSPDGKRILFSGFYKSQRAGGLFTLPIEGGVPSPLTDARIGGTNPCWSPDGQSVAFTRAPEQGRRDIFVVPSAGGTPPNKITSGPDRVVDSELAWSPDGDSIAYFGEDQTIRVVSPTGGPSRVLVHDKSISPDSAYFNGLSWSPDGTELAYAIPPEGPTIKVIPASGGEARTVHTGFNGLVSQVAWSPDGQTFAFTGVTGGDEEIWLMSDFMPLVERAARR